MDLPLGSIFTALTACMTILLTAAYQIYKKDSKNKGFVSCLLLLGLATFWLILFYSIYFLLAISMKMFDQPIAPSLIRMLWPSSLLPYAPLYLAAFSWWHSYLMTLYWLFDDYETNEERESYREFHFNMLKKSLKCWVTVSFIIFLVVQLYYRCPGPIDLTSPLP